MKLTVFLSLVLVVLMGLTKMAEGAICDPGYWPANRAELEGVEQELDEFLGLGKKIAEAEYQKWSRWRLEQLELLERNEKFAEVAELCALHPYAPGCVVSYAGRTELLKLKRADQQHDGDGDRDEDHSEGAERKRGQPRVVVADYELLRRDFPEQLGQLEELEIEQWILDNLVYLSQEGSKVMGYEEGSARAGQLQKVSRLVAEGLYQNSRSSFLIVAERGTKIVAEVVDGHLGYPGELTLGDALHDFTVEKLVEMVLLHSQRQDAFTVGSYAVVDLGHQIHVGVADPLTDEAVMRPGRPALLIRQASRHSTMMTGLGTLGRTIVLEKVLRQYGLTSADAWFGLCEWEKSPLMARVFGFQQLRNAEVELARLLTTARGDILDFASIRGEKGFWKYLCHWLVPTFVLIPPLADLSDPSVRVDQPVWGFDCREQSTISENCLSPFRKNLDRTAVEMGCLVAELNTATELAIEEDVIDQIRDAIYNRLEDVRARLVLQSADEADLPEDRDQLLDKVYALCHAQAATRASLPFADLRLAQYSNRIEELLQTQQQEDKQPQEEPVQTEAIDQENTDDNQQQFQNQNDIIQ